MNIFLSLMHLLTYFHPAYQDALTQKFRPRETRFTNNHFGILQDRYAAQLYPVHRRRVRYDLPHLRRQARRADGISNEGAVARAKLSE